MSLPPSWHRDFPSHPSPGSSGPLGPWAPGHGWRRSPNSPGASRHKGGTPRAWYFGSLDRWLSPHFLWLLCGYLGNGLYVYILLHIYIYIYIQHCDLQTCELRNGLEPRDSEKNKHYILKCSVAWCTWTCQSETPKTYIYIYTEH